ncbi:MAG: DUF433 domain-containing protein [Bryobacterales bacterium]|nr:DUF433 domain-containing protein [Bryobacterales bacterium]MBV9400665.1 DUF433 domain-containing protein [Bryobacterales bacterium]
MPIEYVEERNKGNYLTRTRVSLDSIIQCFNEGMSPETILAEFEGLTLAQVYGAIAYYLEKQPAIDAYLLRQQKRFAESRQGLESLPESLHLRIESARTQLRQGHSD